MMDRLAYLWPEIALFIAACVVMVVGISPSAATRRLAAVFAGLGVVAAGILAWTTTPSGNAVTASSGQVLLPSLALYAKVGIAIVALLLLLLKPGTVDRAEEAAIELGVQKFDALRTNRAEFFSFFLFSIMGLMLVAGADDLIWLFLALELTSLPTYIMVAISGGAGREPAARAQEASVKYFFLGALGAAVFLYGFAMLYGATGSTNLNAIHASLTTGGVSGLALAGLIMSVLGICFKIAAVPMHFYTPDVYQGASPSVAGFLAFVPKTAGFLSLLLLASMVGWTWAPGENGLTVSGGGASLPEPLRILFWVIAALTMTIGNVLALQQKSVRRILAYSSIAHSGYMLVGLIAGPGDGSFTRNGVAAVLFYLFCYGVMNVGTFAVLSGLERKTRDGQMSEIDSIEDIRGLCATHPRLGWPMALCSLSLLGFPPLLGFWAKLPLFTSAISAGEIILVIVLGLNSAIAAFYYLRLFGAVLLEKPEASAGEVSASPFVSRRVAAMVSAALVVALVVVVGQLTDASRKAAAPKVEPAASATIPASMNH
ncbi:MAG: NADH-quinone oxidoreductase subunit N [Phycisphaerales bacterium]|jgi:NADH-quinone oxidoreductase subunit N|nr:NADH-quinone oxidoreductase subunit N [Phycisphaerales bacterium]